MRESTRPDADKVAITAALIELAAATRDTSIDAGVLRVYMPHLDRFAVVEVEEACLALQAEADWFPKVVELLKACAKARRRRQDAAEAERGRLALPDPSNQPISPEKHRELMDRLKAAAHGLDWQKREAVN